MCGIVGLVGDFNYPDVEVLKKMIFIDTIRGEDSTGLAAISLAKRDNVDVFKTTDDGRDFLKHKKAQDLLVSNKIAFIGHNRAATFGSIKEKNAHPFQHKHITGVHNGTLNQGAEHHLTENIEKPRTFEVDSENFFYALSETSPEEALKRTHGAFAFVWYDYDLHAMFFIRNDKRELYYVFSKDRKKMFFMSDIAIFYAARNNTRGGHFEFEDKIHLFEQEILHRLDLPDSFNKSLPDFEKTKILTGTVWRAHKHYHSYNEKHMTREPSTQYKLPYERETGKVLSFKGHNPNKLSEFLRVKKSREIWNEYDNSKEARSKNADYYKHIDKKVGKISRQEVIKMFQSFDSISNELFAIFADAVAIPKSTEYEPDDTANIVKLMGKLDYIQDVLRTWSTDRPSSVVDVIKAEVLRLKINPDIVLTESFNTIKAKEEAAHKPVEDLDDKNNQPSGLGNLTFGQFTTKVKNEGCGNCKSQNIMWEPSECAITVEGQLICPECITDTLFMSYVSQGVVKLA